jgi:hypothetical protein
MPSLTTHVISRPFVIGIFAAMLVAPVAAQQTVATGVWTAVANTGEVDSSNQNIYQTNSTGSVAFRSSATGKITLRYNVSGIPTVFRQPFDPDDDGPDQRIQLMARIRDTGAGARVIVRLRALNLDTGALSTLARIDSDESFSGGSTDYINEFAYLQVPSTFQFDFWHFGYYVEVEMTKATTAANPGVMAVQICNPAGACQEGI